MGEFALQITLISNSSNYIINIYRLVQISLGDRSVNTGIPGRHPRGHGNGMDGQCPEFTGVIPGSGSSFLDTNCGRIPGYIGALIEVLT